MREFPEGFRITIYKYYLRMTSILNNVFISHRSCYVIIEF